MKLKEELYRTIRHYAGLITRNGKKISPDFNEKVIHQFRTTVKKLRALLRWQEAAGGIFTPSFKKLYHASGEIRDGQVLLKKISADKIALPSVSLWLATYIGKKQKEWDDVYDKELLHDWKKNVHQLSLKGKIILPGSFYKKKLESVRQLAGTVPATDNMLHETRKQVKDMQYVLRWNEKKHPGHGIKPARLHELENISRQAGNYMDQCNALNLLARYLKEETDKSALKPVTTLKSSWQKQKRVRKGRLIKAMQSVGRVQTIQEPS